MSGEEALAGGSTTLHATWRAALLAVTALLGALVIGALIYTVAGADQARDRALAAQSHSYEVVILTRTLAENVAEAEASLGRYVIGTNRNTGQLFSDQWSSIGDKIDRLEIETAENAAQQARIAKLRDDYAKRGQELSHIAVSTSLGRNEAALAHYYEAGKAPSLAAIDADLDDIIQAERDQLLKRNATAEESVRHSNVEVRTLSIFGVLIVIGAIVLGWLVTGAMEQRARADAEAAAERSRAVVLEAAVDQATADLHQQAREREDAEAKLRQIQKMEAIGQLTGGIAHDFNNMLAVVVGGLELARRQIGPIDPLATRHIDAAAEGAERAAALTRQLLALARAEPVRPEAVTPGAVIGEMSNLLDRTLGDGIRIEVRDEGLGWRSWVDRHQLENAVLNLAVNARDAMDGRGLLEIETGTAQLEAEAIGDCAAGDYVTVAVIDHGHGMSREVIDRAFEPFFTTKEVGKGTGLGLSQTFAFVQQVGGCVAIDSAINDGTTVTLYLPRHGAEAPAMRLVAKKAPARGRKPKARAPRALSILVVEDDHRVLAATMGALKELGHQPIACGDPLAAPALLERSGAVDLIVSDVLMPGQTGPEMIAALAPRHPDAAVLFVTGYAGDGAGAAEFAGYPVLRKPFTLVALERAVAEAMAADRPMANSDVAAE